MKAFVTGSTGLLGSNLVNQLVAAGYEVRALARSAAKARSLLRDPRIEIVVGDMENIPAFASHLEGCDVLFHTAAYFREYFGLGDHWAKLNAINIDGTVQLLAAAEKHGVRKAIYVSSSGVIGHPTNGRIADESTPPDRSVNENLYFKSKLLAEQAVAEFLKTHTLPVVLILPTVMLGPQDAAPTAVGQAIISLLERKMPIVPPGGFPFVDARDVAQAMINAVERGQSGQRYIISNQYLTMAAFAHYVERVSGVPAPRRSVPYGVMLGIAALSEFAARFTGRSPQIGVSAVRAMYETTDVSSAKAVRELGVVFRNLEHTIRDEVNWFVENDYVWQSTGAVLPVQTS